jgi:predicted phosphate transport protein (TIGR00153 family)
MPGANSFLRIFTPKNPIFYGFFEEIADHVLTMAQQLNVLVREPNDEKRQEIVKEIVRLEQVCDDISHTVITELSRNFITPFDREDIHYLATSLDDVADYIYSSAKQIDFYHINPLEDGVRNLSQLILSGAEDLKKAVYGLREMKELRSITGALLSINAMEHKANDIFDLNIDKLFEIEQDFKQLIKRRELYQTMESATDKCQDAGNVIESIVIKYG